MKYTIFLRSKHNLWLIKFFGQDWYCLLMEERKITNKDLVFGRRLQRVRKRMGLTQEQLADKTRLSTTFVGLVETGRRRPSLKSLQKIADALGVSIKELF